MQGYTGNREERRKNASEVSVIFLQSHENSAPYMAEVILNMFNYLFSVNNCEGFDFTLPAKYSTTKLASQCCGSGQKI